MNDKKRIPNFNTLSTLIDRLSIENVKLAHFEDDYIEYFNINKKNTLETENKINTQKLIIEDLKKELNIFMVETFVSGGYNYRKEERTFN